MRFMMTVLLAASFLGVCAIALGKTPAIERPEASHAITAKDPQTSEFPAGRGTNQLIVYTPAFGKQTGTNPYGLEATIRNGMVIRCEGNDSLIPADGFIISGHGKSADWIADNLTPGTEVRLDKNAVHAKFSAKSKVYEIEQRLAEIQKQSKPEAAGALKKAEESLNSAKQALKAGDPTRGAKLLADADLQSRTALFASCPSVTPEARGVWFHFYGKSPNDARELVSRAESTGFNMLFPETYYWSSTLCPKLSADSPDQDKNFRGWDPLKALIDEAHKHGIQVHAWCHIFFIGTDDPALASLHPTWVAKDHSGKSRASAEEGFWYFCPSNPDARAYIQNQLVLLVQKYPGLDGIQYDYIRFPTSVPFEKGFCYCDHCRAEFSKDSGVDPISIDPEKDAATWDKWNKWREQRITSFVEEASTKLRAARSTIKLSAAVFPVAEVARVERFQYWPDFANKHLIDFVCPMLYFTDATAVSKGTAANVANAGGIPVYAGLGPFLKLSDVQLVRQIEAARDSKANGQVLFCEEGITAAQREALKVGPYRSKAAVK